MSLIPLVFTGHAASWKSQTLKLPSNADVNAADQGSVSLGFYAIQCPDVNDCVAIAAYPTTSQGEGTVIETEVKGKWMFTSVPPKGAAKPFEALFSLACPAVGKCVAVGATGGADGGETGTLLYRQNGSSWSAATVGVPKGGLPSSAFGSYRGLDDISCASTAFCVTTGFYTDASGSFQGLISEGGANTWSPRQAQHPVGAGVAPDVILNVATCFAAGSCVAAGTSGLEGLMETEANGKWSAAAVSPPKGLAEIATFYGTSCGAKNSCVAVGIGTDATGTRPEAVVQIWSAGKLTMAEPGLPTGAAKGSLKASELNSVACPKPGACIAVGVYLDASGNSKGLILRQGKSGWTATTSPLPKNPGNLSQSYLSSIACPSATTCVATGYYFHGSQGPAESLILTWSAGEWKALEAPLPKNAKATAGQESQLGSVSCVDSSECTAVGEYFDSAGNEEGLVVSDAANVWTAKEIQILGADLYSVACSSATACTALGTYSNQNGEFSFIATGSGANWSHQLTPIPGGNAANGLATSVGCTTAGSCVISGQYVDGNGDSLGFLDTGSGQHWTTETAPTPAAAQNSEPNVDVGAVGCPASGACLAVGEYEAASGGPVHGLLLQQK